MKKITTFALILTLSYVGFAQQQEVRNLRHEFTPEEREQLRLSSEQQDQSTRGQRGRQTPEEREQMLMNSAQRQTERLKELLNLSEEQENAVSEINYRYAILRIQVSQVARTEERADLRELLSELDEKRDAEILPVLNEKQAELFIQSKNDQQERREQMRHRVEERRLQRELEKAEGQR
jgi:hypothetical protein